MFSISRIISRMFSLSLKVLKCPFGNVNERSTLNLVYNQPPSLSSCHVLSVFLDVLTRHAGVFNESSPPSTADGERHKGLGVPKPVVWSRHGPLGNRDLPLPVSITLTCLHAHSCSVIWQPELPITLIVQPRSVSVVVGGVNLLVSLSCLVESTTEIEAESLCTSAKQDSQPIKICQSHLRL